MQSMILQFHLFRYKLFGLVSLNADCLIFTALTVHSSESCNKYISIQFNCIAFPTVTAHFISTFDLVSNMMLSALN